MRQDAMTSEKAMLSRAGRGRRSMRATLVLIVVVAAGLAGCRLFEKPIERPQALVSPYPADKLWAVAPLRNESGTTLVDSFTVADKLAQQVEQVSGITVLPVNRVLEAMRATGLERIGSVGQAMGLMQTLDADGLIVGTVTAWDPYEPPKIGATVQLYTRRAPDAAGVDTRALTYAATDDRLPGLIEHDQPTAQASGYFDAANGEVLTRIKAYATGRTPLDSPAGWRAYLLSMDLYTEFVSYELTRRLLDSEWRRMTPAPTPQPPADANDT